MSVTIAEHDLKTLVLSLHPLIVVETVEEDRLRARLESLSTELRMPLFTWTVTRGLTRAREDRGTHRTEEPLMLLKHLELLSVEAIFLLHDFGRHLAEPVVCRKLREVVQHFSTCRSTLVLCGEDVELPRELEHHAAYYELELPRDDELRGAVQGALDSLRRHHRIKLRIRQTELEDLIRALAGMTLSQARQTIAYCMLDDGELSVEDVRNVLDRKAQVIREGGLLEYYPAERNAFELGGFENLKAWLERARVGFGQEARELNLEPPRGILLVGVQGCGKSLAAKVTARQWNLPLLKLDAGRLFDKYIGESEKNFRKAIALAESMAPVVLWIDEIEKGMAPTGRSEGDSGLSRRLFGSFLTWLQEKDAAVFVVATANDLFSLPPELLRKGRFDETFFVDLPDAGERTAITEIHLRLRKQDPAGFDMAALVTATDGFSGAEIEQAVIAALYRTLHEKRPLDTATLVDEVRGTVPLSVSRREDIERLREMARGRFVSVK